MFVHNPCQQELSQEDRDRRDFNRDLSQCLDSIDFT